MNNNNKLLVQITGQIGDQFNNIMQPIRDSLLHI